MQFIQRFFDRLDILLSYTRRSRKINETKNEASKLSSFYSRNFLYNLDLSKNDDVLLNDSLIILRRRLTFSSVALVPLTKSKHCHVTNVRKINNTLPIKPTRKTVPKVGPKPPDISTK